MEENVGGLEGARWREMGEQWRELDGGKREWGGGGLGKRNK
jgi:hypothetical protein